MPIKRILLCAALMLYPGRDAAVAAQTPPGPMAPAVAPAPYVPATFAAELRRLYGVLEKRPSPPAVAALRKDLPGQWTVATSERTYSVSSEFLRDKLGAGQLSAAQEWLEDLADQTESYEVASSPGAANAKTELSKILDEGEFAAVRPPTPWEQFRQRLGAWVQDLLRKLILGMARHPIGGQILFWVIIVVGVSFIAFWLFRFATRFDRINSLPRSQFMAPSRSWQEWVRLAREAAARGNFREAVHAAYWAGIVHLQEIGALPKDRSKTPREYLRIASRASASGVRPNPDYREPLAGLTSRLEKIWYANRNADSNDFRDSLSQLEALGCRLE